MNIHLNSFRKGLIATSLCLAVTSSLALDPIDSGSNLFTIEIEVDSGTPKTFGFNSVESLYDSIDDDSLEKEFPAYNKTTSAVGTQINYRGVAFLIDYTANNTDLVFRIPDLNISETFTGTTRSASNDLLEKYFEENDNIVNRLNKLLSEKSATDPIAGNPSSLMGNMVDNAFSTASATTTTTTSSSSTSSRVESSDSSGDSESSETAAAAESKQSGSVFSTGVHFGRFRQNGKDVTSYNVPLRFDYRLENDKQVLINIPFSYVEVNGAESYKLGLDLAMKFPIDNQWSLTPGIGWGVVASGDLASAGQIGSFSISSLYTLDQSTFGGDDWTFSFANFVGIYKTIPIKLNDVNVDPDITNTVSKNGIITNMKTEFFGNEANFQAYLTDTRFFGDNLYTNHYNEVGVYITPVDQSGYRKYMSVNLSYLFGDNDIEGVNGSLNYSF